MRDDVEDELKKLRRPGELGGDLVSLGMVGVGYAHAVVGHRIGIDVGCLSTGYMGYGMNWVCVGYERAIEIGRWCS
jgi:hypothetical protein